MDVSLMTPHRLPTARLLTLSKTLGTPAAILVARTLLERLKGAHIEGHGDIAGSLLGSGKASHEGNEGDQE